MDKEIAISQEQLKCLRRHLDEANRLLQGLGVREQNSQVREQTAPKLSAREKRIKHYSELLNAPKKRK